jgi:aryl sulfotransferase
VTAPLVRYSNFMSDNDRWNDLELRDGDIVVATPAKCGTTWMQSICALLVFGGPDLPAGIDELSPWVDLYTKSRKALVAQLDAQTHRRFMKTHTPLDGLPFDPRVTYICVGRDPRDAGISMDHHMANMDMERMLALREDAVSGEDVEDPPPPEEPAPTLSERFRAWVDIEDLIGLQRMLHHLATFWDRRDEPNVVMLHYDDLKSDLEGQMRGLADRLGIAIPEERWPDLVGAATFDQMKRNADTFAPEPTLWRDKAEFFHKGRSGQWRELLGEEDLRNYADRVAALIPADLADWIHRGDFRP